MRAWLWKIAVGLIIAGGVLAATAPRAQAETQTENIVAEMRTYLYLQVASDAAQSFLPGGWTLSPVTAGAAKRGALRGNIVRRCKAGADQPLRKAGVEPAFCLDHGLTISLYYKDPEGNFVELQSDNFGDWAKSAEFMRTSADFATNPIGTFFDPARVYEKMKSGADFKTLQKSIRTGDYLPNPIPPHIGLPTP